MKTSGFLTLFVLFTSFLPTGLFAEVIHVPTDQPTIQAAIEQAGPYGDTVLVAPGTYEENIDFLEKEVAVKSESGPEFTIIQGDGSVPVVTMARESGYVVGGYDIPNWLMLEGFKITGGRGKMEFHPYYAERVGGGIYCDGVSPVISSCWVTGNTAETGGGIYFQNGSPEILQCDIFSNTGGGIAFHGHNYHLLIAGCRIAMNRGSGIAGFAESLGSAMILGCTIGSNESDAPGGGIRLENIYFNGNQQYTIVNTAILQNSAPYGGGLYLSGDVYAGLNLSTIINNDAHTAGGGIALGDARAHLTLLNSILWANTAPAGDQYWEEEPDFGNFDSLYSDVMGGAPPGEGNFSADPLFTETTYQISEDSPCRDAATDQYSDLVPSLYPPLDLLGSPRPVGEGWDVGADEFCDDTATDADGDGLPFCYDCDDTNPNTYYRAPEICDGLDNDCDGWVPVNEMDIDADGYMACQGDCDDRNPDFHPGAEEVCDGRDHDCDGVISSQETDIDADGYLACDDDCDDENPDVHPGAEEVCDGLDNDCDGQIPSDEVDGDGDRYLACNDCDDNDPDVHPGAPENGFDGIDSNCSCGGGPVPFNSSCDSCGTMVFKGAPTPAQIAGNLLLYLLPVMGILLMRKRVNEKGK